jgi:hypothetical protein
LNDVAWNGTSQELPAVDSELSQTRLSTFRPPFIHYVPTQARLKIGPVGRLHLRIEFFAFTLRENWVRSDLARPGPYNWPDPSLESRLIPPDGPRCSCRYCWRLPYFITLLFSAHGPSPWRVMMEFFTVSLPLQATRLRSCLRGQRYVSFYNATSPSKMKWFLSATRMGFMANKPFSRRHLFPSPNRC